MVQKKATTCDLCTEQAEPSCVYACPHDAAHRVEPRDFFAGDIGAASWKNWTCPNMISEGGLNFTCRTLLMIGFRPHVNRRSGSRGAGVPPAVFRCDTITKAAGGSRCYESIGE